MATDHKEERPDAVASSEGLRTLAGTATPAGTGLGDSNRRCDCCLRSFGDRKLKAVGGQHTCMDCDHENWPLDPVSGRAYRSPRDCTFRERTTRPPAPEPPAQGEDSTGGRSREARGMR